LAPHSRRTAREQAAWLRPNIGRSVDFELHPRGQRGRQGEKEKSTPHALPQKRASVPSPPIGPMDDCGLRTRRRDSPSGQRACSGASRPTLGEGVDLDDGRGAGFAYGTGLFVGLFLSPAGGQLKGLLVGKLQEDWGSRLVRELRRSRLRGQANIDGDGRWLWAVGESPPPTRR
jgi:hypothetical protein